MDMSFWVGTIGASQAQRKLDVVSNNLANANNNGFKPKNAVFSELVNYNLNAGRNEVTDLQAGAGAIVSTTNTDFRAAALTQTDRQLDYALTVNNEFFQVRDQATGAILLTRDGHFHAGEMQDGRFVLMTDANKFVLNAQGDLTYLDVSEGADKGRLAEGQQIGVFTVPFPSRLQNVGDDDFRVREGDNNNPITPVEWPSVITGALEQSGTDIAKEFTNLIEAQRAFSYNLRMVQTSDEVAQTVNGLR
jgi:flagellar basal-body rod protein FlgG